MSVEVALVAERRHGDVWSPCINQRNSTNLSQIFYALEEMGVGTPELPLDVNAETAEFLKRPNTIEQRHVIADDILRADWDVQASVRAFGFKPESENPSDGIREAALFPASETAPLALWANYFGLGFWFVELLDGYGEPTIRKIRRSDDEPSVALAGAYGFRRSPRDVRFCWGWR